jgi:flagellar biosynthesis protein FliR
MSSDFSLFILIFARFTGFFLIAPLFTRLSIPSYTRIGLAFSISLLIAPSLLQQQTLKIPEWSIFFALQIIKEMAIGYLCGFVFSLLFEAGAFAGQLVGTLAGFSATEFLDPFSRTEHPLLARFFPLILFALFLSFDLHHTLIRLLFESFNTFPLEEIELFSHQRVFAILEAVAYFFQQAISLALYPLIILSMIIAMIALLSRFFPIFWLSFPLQFLVGAIAIASGIHFFPPLVKKAYFQFWVLVKNTIVNY